MEIIGTGGDDTLRGTTSDDYIDGGSGNDLLVGEHGNDWFVGGAGNDTIHGDAPFSPGDTADYGSALTDIVVDLEMRQAIDGLGGFDTLYGIENIHGGAGNDTLNGDSFDNAFYPEAGRDVIDGRWGNDLVIYDSALPGLVVNLGTGRATGGDIGTDFLLSIESAQGSQHADTITLSAATGGTAYGKAGDDTLTGGASHDNIKGGSGNDTLEGGPATDTLLYDIDATDGVMTGLGVTVNLGLGFAIDNWGHTDAIHGFERVIGSPFGDSITGSAPPNTLHGEGGEDTLRGGPSDDILDGGTGIDRVVFNMAFGEYDLQEQQLPQFHVVGEGRDVLVAVERLVFADVNVAVDLGGNAGFVAKIFNTVFGEWSVALPVAVGVGLDIADHSGLDYMELMQLALDERLGPAPTNEAVVELLYTRISGAAPDPAVRDVYVSWITERGLTQLDLALMAAEVVGIPEFARDGLVYLE